MGVFLNPLHWGVESGYYYIYETNISNEIRKLLVFHVDNVIVGMVKEARKHNG